MADRFIGRRGFFISNFNAAKQLGRSAYSRKPIRKSHALLALSAAAGIASLSSYAKADTYGSLGTSPLNLNGAWTDETGSTDTQPGAADIAQWDSNSNGLTSYALGGILNWGEISVINTYTPATLTIDDAGSEGTDILTLTGIGGVGISAGSATANITIEDSVVVGGAQSWTTNTGQTLTVGGAAASTLADNNLLTLVDNGNINISAGITGTGGMTLTGAGTVSLTGVSTYTGTTSITTGTLQVGNASAMGNSRVNITSGATLNLNGSNLGVAFINNGASLSGGIIDNLSATNVTLTVGSGQGGITGAASGTYQATDMFSGIIQDSSTGTVSLTKVATAVANQGNDGIIATVSQLNGSQVLVLTNKNTYTGATTIEGGVLDLNFDQSNANGGPIATNIINPLSPLVLQGGDLIALPVGSGTQSFASTTLNAGASHVAAYRLGSNTTVINLAAITRNIGSTIDFQNRPSTSGSSNAHLGAADGTDNTTTADANFTGGSVSILGGYATYNGTSWAVSAGTGSASGAITALGTYSATYAAGTNVDSAIGTQTPASMTINSLRFNNAGAYTINTGGNLTIATGGILETGTVGNNAVSINNNSITSNNGTDLIVIQNNDLNPTAGMTIGSNITGSIGLTKSGLGNLTLTPNTANNFTGQLTINGGALILGNSSALPSTPVPVVFAGTTQMTGGLTIWAGNEFINANGILDVNGTSNSVASLTSSIVSSGTAIVQNANASAGTLTINGSANTSFAGNVADGTGGGSLSLIMNSTGTQTLAGSNTYTGNTTVSGGDLILASLPSSTNYTVSTGAKLDITGVSNSLLTLTSGKTLSGGGTLLGSVVANAGSTITPGANGTGTLTVSNLTVNSGANLTFGLNGTPTNNLIDVTHSGGLILNGTFASGGFTLFASGTANSVTTDGTYDLLQYTGTGPSTSGLSSASITNPVAGLTYNFSDNSGFVQLVIGGTPQISAVWVTNGSGAWANGANWSTNPSFPNGSGLTASFTTALTTPATVDLASTNETVGTIMFNPQSSTNAYTIGSSGGGKLILDNTGNGAALITQSFGSIGNLNITAPIVLNSNITTSVLSGNTLTLSGGISPGTDPTSVFTKTGTGTVVLSGSNLYTGGTVISQGVLQFASGSLGSGGITFNGGTLQWGNSTTDDISSQTVTIAANGGTLDTNGNNVTLNNSIGNGGSGGLTKVGAGTLTLSGSAGANTYTGGTTVSGGILNFSNAGNLASGGITLNTGGTLQWATGTTTDISTQAVTANGGTIDANGNAVNLANAIGNSSSGALILTSTNTTTPGSFTLNAASTYSGNTTITATSPASINVVLNTGATLGSGSTITFGGNAGTLTSASSGTVTLPNVVVPSSVTGTIVGSTLALSRTAITGLSGSGNLNLVANNVNASTNNGAPVGVIFDGGTVSGYTGTITMSSGTAGVNNTVVLDVNGAGFSNNLGSATVNLTNYVRLSETNNSGGNTLTLGALEGDNTSILAGSDYGGGSGGGFNVTVGGLNSNTTFAGSLVNGATGDLTLIKQGNGVLTLSGGSSSNYTGNTTINAGTLRVTNTSGSATGYSPAIAVNDGGTLSGTGIISAVGGSAATVVTVAAGTTGGTVAVDYPTLVGPILSTAIPTLTMDNLTLNAPTAGQVAPQLNFELTGPSTPGGQGTSDLIDVASTSAGGGGLSINGGVANFYNATTGALFTTPGVYNLIEYGSLGSDALSESTAELAQSAITYSIAPGSYNGNNYIQLIITQNPASSWTNSSSDNTWENASNWTNGEPNAVSAIASFIGSSFIKPGPNTAQNVTLSSNPTIGSLVFNSSSKVSISGSGQLSFNNGPSTPGLISDTTTGANTQAVGVNLSFGGEGISINVTDPAGSLTFTGGTNGSGPISTSGPGTVTFSTNAIQYATALNVGTSNSGTTGNLILAVDAPNMNGPTTVDGGTLTLASANALSGSVLSLPGAGATLVFQSGITTFNVAGIGGTSAAAGGNIALVDTASSAVTLNVGGQGANFTYSGALSGSGSLVKSGGGTMTLTGVSNIGGSVTVSGGQLIVAAANGYTAANTTLASNTGITINAGESFTSPVTMNGNSTFTFLGTGSVSTFPTNGITLSPTATTSNPAIMLSSGSEASEYGGLITFDGGGASAITFEDTVTAISLNSATTNFSGVGTAIVPAGDAIRFTNGGGNSTNGAAGVTFDVDGSLFTRTGTTGTGIVIGALTDDSGQGNLGSESSSGGAGTLYTIGGLGLTTTFGGTITDAADGGTAITATAVTLVGGTLTLSGSGNTYSGNTTVNGGTLNIPAGTSLDSINVSVASTSATGAVLNLTGTLNGATPIGGSTLSLPVVSASATAGTAVLIADNAGGPGSGYFTRNWHSLTVGTGGTIKLTNSISGESNRTVLVLGSSTSTPTVAGATTFSGGSLDLGINDMIVKEPGGTTGVAVATTELSSLTTAANTGFNTGVGLISSAAISNPEKNTGIAVVVNDTHQSGTLSGTTLLTTFDGQSVGDGDILVKYTFYGDSLLTGTVTAADYGLIDNAYNVDQTSPGTLTGWYNGDYNYDTVINGDDYTLIDNAYNTQSITGSITPLGLSTGPAEMIASDTDQIAGASASAVPEPTTLGMLGIGAAGMLMRRRRRNA